MARNSQKYPEMCPPPLVLKGLNKEYVCENYVYEEEFCGDIVYERKCYVMLCNK